MIKHFFKSTIHESLLTGILLALVGGFLDIYTYILKGHVFANAQTGNIVLMGYQIAEGNWLDSLYYLVPVTAFFIGVLISEYVKHKSTNVQLLEWQHFIIILEIVILFFIAIIPSDFSNLVCNTTIGLVCSMQTNAFKTTDGLPYATTMCTGNLRNAGVHLSNYFIKKDKNALKASTRYLVIILAFVVGAIIASILVTLFHEISLLFCCVVLLITLLILIY